MSFNVTILGSSSAVPTPQRNTSAQVVSLNENLYLTDCGEGTQIQMKKFNIRFQKIRHIFISHLHGDHFFGLIGLISTYCLTARSLELHIYGPSALQEILSLQLQLTGTVMTFPVFYHSIDPGLHAKIFEDDHLEVFTLPMVHRMPACGFLFSEKPHLLNIRKDFLEKESPSWEEIRKIKKGEDFTSREGVIYPNATIVHAPVKPLSYAYCTDTAYNESLIPLIRNVDVLYHEATFMKDSLPRAEERFHSTAEQAATIALKAGAGRLVLGHFSPRYKDLGPLLEEARELFPCTELAEDGKIIEIGRVNAL